MGSLTHELRNCDAYELLSSLPEGSADLVLTDQPYETTVLDFDATPIDYDRLLELSWRALKPNGWLILFGRGRFVAGIIQRPEFIFERVWIKSRKTLGQMAKLRPLIQHEWVMHLNRDRTGGTYNPQMLTGYKPKGVIKRLKTDSGKHYAQGVPNTYVEKAGVRYPTTIMTYDAPPLEYDNPIRKNGVTHPTAKPIGLLKELILTHTDPGELVIDPFCGGDSTRASTAEAAYIAGRCFIGSESNPVTYAGARARLDKLRQQPMLF